MNIEYELQNHFKIISNKDNNTYTAICTDTNKELELDSKTIFCYKRIKYICPCCRKVINFQTHLDKCNRMFVELAEEIYIEKKYKGKDLKLKKMALKYYYEFLGSDISLNELLKRLGYIVKPIASKEEFIKLAKDIYINDRYKKNSKEKAAKYMRLKNMYYKLELSNKSLYDYLLENNLRTEDKRRKIKEMHRYE